MYILLNKGMISKEKEVSSVSDHVCTAIIRKTNTPCMSKASIRIGDNHYCILHGLQLGKVKKPQDKNRSIYTETNIQNK